jgi:NAD-reducing hydrogenase large subunit
MESSQEKRNIFTLAQTHPEIARDGVRLRQFGQQVIEWIAGKRLHPDWIVPGGAAEPLTAEVRDRILQAVPDALAIMTRTLPWFKRTMDDYAQEIRTFGNFPSMFMGTVDRRGNLDLYDGALRLVDERGKRVEEGFDPLAYQDYIGEAVEPWSYTKFPYYKPMGYPEGMYRVGPLARLNVVDACGTPRADQELTEFRQLDRNVVLSSFHFHYARLIEMLYCVEKIEQLLNDPDILDPQVRAFAGANSREGVGVTEAPRGTLIHHYKIDRQGRIAWANMVVSTTHNNLAMNRAVKQVASRYVNGNNLTEGMLNRVEAVIRTFDPCLSCSSHAENGLALHVQLIDPAGNVLDEAVRG